MTTCVTVPMLSEVWNSNHHHNLQTPAVTHIWQKETVQSSEKLLHFHYICMKILPGMQQDLYWSNKSWSCFTYFTEKSKKKNQYLFVKKKKINATVRHLDSSQPCLYFTTTAAKIRRKMVAFPSRNQYHIWPIRPGHACRHVSSHKIKD